VKEAPNSAAARVEARCARAAAAGGAAGGATACLPVLCPLAAAPTTSGRVNAAHLSRRADVDTPLAADYIYE
jgi:hypothetical protein